MTNTSETGSTGSSRIVRLSRISLDDGLLSGPFVRSLDTSVSPLVARLLTTAQSLAYLVVVRMLLLFYELHV